LSLKYESIFNQFDVIGPKATEFGKTTRNNGRYAVQSHSRSPTLVSIDSPYATSCYWSILTYILAYLSPSYCRWLIKFALSIEGTPI